MAEAIGLASSIAGLLSLTIEVYKLSAEFIRDVRDASKTVQLFLQELKDLKTVLFQFENLASEDEDEDIFKTRPSALHAVQEFKPYRAELERLRDKLQKRESGSSLKRKLKAFSWPFSEESTQQTVDMLHRVLQTFQGAISLDTYVVATQTYKEVRKINEERQATKLQTILDWLASSEMQQKQDDVFSRRHGETGNWLLENAAFQNWLRAEESINTIWCPGAPGAGKTVLTSVVINHLKQSYSGEDVGIAFVYCDYKEQSHQTAAELIGTLSKQLAAKKGLIIKPLTDLYEMLSKDKRKPDVKQLEQILQALCTLFTRAFIIVDALDECDRDKERPAFLKVLENLRGAETAKVFVTSRPNPEDIQACFEDVPQVQIKASKSDITSYIHERTEGNRAFMKRLGTDQAKLVTQITDTIADRAAGMFLMAVLQLEQIWTERTKGKILKALEKLPTKLEETYGDTVNRIKKQAGTDGALGLRILQWVSSAKRPLTVDEIRHALALELDDDDELPDDLDRDNLLDPQSLVDVCAGLVMIEGKRKKSKRETVRLVHFTAQNYLANLPQPLYEGAKRDIPRTCIAYLSFEVFEDISSKKLSDYKRKVREYPFLNYAAGNWGDHAKEDFTEETRRLALDFLKQDSKLESSLLAVQMDDKRLHYETDDDLPKSVNGLHVAAALGLVDLFDTLLEAKDASPNAKDVDGLTPLSWAAKLGQREMVQKLLLREDVELEVEDNSGRTPLSWAAEESYEDVVRLLLEKRNAVKKSDAVNAVSEKKLVSIDHENRNGSTPLHLSSKYGHEKVVQLLLDGGADVNHMNKRGSTPLSVAVRFDEGEVVAILLKHGADVNPKDPPDRKGENPLQAAAYLGSEELVKTLIEKGAILESQTGEHGSALIAAVSGGEEDALKLLLDLGADINALDREGGDALLNAAWENEDTIVKLLLDRGAKMNVQGGRYGNALCAAVDDTYGNEAEETTVRLLLDNGADVNAEGFYSEGVFSGIEDSSLDSSSEWEDADDDSKGSSDEDNPTKAPAAVKPSRVKVEDGQEEKVTHGSNSARKDSPSESSDSTDSEDSGSSSNSGSSSDSGDSDNDADYSDNEYDNSSGDEDDYSFYDSDEDSEDSEDSADPKAALKKGRPLHIAADRGHKTTVSLLLGAKNVEPNCQDPQGKTPLHIAVEKGRLEAVRLLVRDERVNIDMKNSDGLTAQELAAKLDKKDVIQVFENAKSTATAMEDMRTLFDGQEQDEKNADETSIAPSHASENTLIDAKSEELSVAPSRSSETTLVEPAVNQPAAALK